MERFFDSVRLAAWLLAPTPVGSPSMDGGARNVASTLGILLLAGLWLYLLTHRDRRAATLAVFCILGLASGAGHVLGKEARLQLLRGGIVPLLLFLEVFVDLPRGWRAALQTVVVFFVIGILAAFVGRALAVSLDNAGRAGQMVVEVLASLFF